MNKIVDRWILDHKDELINSLKESVRIPSVEGAPEPNAPFGREVRRALDHALALARSFGFTTIDMDGYIGVIDYGEGEETLGVMCHLDVVPEGEGWDNPPYAAETVDGCIVGRGTLDDKGPAMSSIYALAAIKAAGLKTKRRIRIMLGCNEESGWGCMKHYGEVAKMPDIAFSPDGEYPVVNSEKAIVHASYRKPFKSALRIEGGTRPNVVCGKVKAFIPMCGDKLAPIVKEFSGETQFPCTVESTDGGCEIEITGLGAHASTPELGKNALQAMMALLSRLELQDADAAAVRLLHEKLAMDMHGEALGLDFTDASGRMTLNPGVIKWDENGIAKLDLDMRVPTSVDLDELMAKLNSQLDGFELFNKSVQPGHFVAPDSELVSKLTDVYAKRSGEYLPPLAIGGGTYARAVENAVAFGCERPGVPALVHMPNESISIEDMMFNTYMIADAIIALGCE